jgi:hypothetical protein
LVGSVQAPPEAEPLPDLNIGPAPGNGVLLQLPVLLDYAGMTTVLEQRYLGKTLELPQGRIEFLKFKLYSAGKNLVLGALIKTQSSGLLLNTQGWLYLQGEPIYLAEAQQLQVENFAFTRQLDNPLISSASWVLQDSLRDQLGAALSYDLSADIDKTRSSMHARINRPIGDGFVMSGTVSELSLQGIQPRANDLLVLLRAGGNIAIASKLSLPPPNTMTTDRPPQAKTSTEPNDAP